jgi:uncharacterized protein (DUF2126 family)
MRVPGPNKNNIKYCTKGIPIQLPVIKEDIRDIHISTSRFKAKTPTSIFSPLIFSTP